MFTPAAYPARSTTRTRWAIVLTACLLCTAPAGAQQAAPHPAPQPAPDFSAVERATRAFMTASKIPGVAVAVVQGDSIVYARGFGVASLETGVAVTPDMLFQIGSVTKAFTAMTVLSLAEEGKLALDSAVGRYVTGLHPAVARVSVGQLLSHSAGLKDESAEYGSHDEGAFAAYARSWGADYALLPPGTTFSYSNPGFTLAGLAAQEAGGKPYDRLVQDRVFAPLGMARSTFRPTEAMTHPVAVGHRGRRGEAPAVVRPMADDTRHWPAGYVYTSAAELARFAGALLNGGRFGGRQALPASAVRQAITPRVEVPNDLEPARYAYGLFVETYRGVPTVWHAGDMPGYTAVVRVLPEQRLALVVLANRQGVRPDPVLDGLLEAYRITPPPARPRPQPLVSLSAAEMARLAGRYTNRFTVELFVRDGGLWLRQPDGAVRAYPIGRNRFTTDSARTFRPAEFEVYPAGAGRPGYLNLYVWGFARDTTGR